MRQVIERIEPPGIDKCGYFNLKQLIVAKYGGCAEKRKFVRRAMFGY